MSYSKTQIAVQLVDSHFMFYCARVPPRSCVLPSGPLKPGILLEVLRTQSKPATQQHL